MTKRAVRPVRPATKRKARTREAAPELDVRPAKLADVHAIARIHVRAWREGYKHLMPASLLRSLSIARRKARWRITLRERGAEFLVAERRGRMLGWIVVGRSRDADAERGTGELWSITVDPSAWRLGVGRALWLAAEELLRPHYRTVTLWVLKDNERARRFYKTIGFSQERGVTKLFEAGGARLVEVRLRKPLRSRAGRRAAARPRLRE